MKKIIALILILFSSLCFTFTSFASGWQLESDTWKYYNEDGTNKTGWFYDVNYSSWYYFNEDGIMLTNSWIESNGKNYYLSGEGKMLINAVTPDGKYVDKNGVAVDISYNKGFDNVKEDMLSFLCGEEIVSIPCKIYYNNQRTGVHTTLQYNSVGMEVFNGETPNLIVTYTVLRTGGYRSTYIGCDVYVNGIKAETLGGADGNVRAKFDSNYTVFQIPFNSLKKDDTMEIYINNYSTPKKYCTLLTTGL